VKREATTAITSRGCPHHCAFCSAGAWITSTRQRSANSVLQEVHQIRQMGYEAIHFYDDSLALEPKRLKAICEGMEESSGACFVRADQMNQERLDDMRGRVRRDRDRRGEWQSGDPGCDPPKRDSGAAVVRDRVRTQGGIRSRRS